MLTRHFELCKHVQNIDFYEFNYFLLSQSWKRKVDHLLCQLHQVNEVTQKLQKAKSSVHCARSYFHDVLEQYPCLSTRLKPGARIVHNLALESTLIKEQYNKEDRLPLQEENLFVHLPQKPVEIDF